MKFAPGSPAAMVAARSRRSASSSAAHRQSVKAGQAYEAIADRMHRECAVAGVAHVERVNSHLRIVGASGPTLKAVATGPSCIDCLGRLRGGRAVAVEVKGTPVELDAERRPLPLAFPLANVKPHQAAWLDASVADGALTLLLVIHGLPPLDTAYAVPWEAVKASGLRTLRPEFLEPWRVRRGVPYLARFLPEVTR